MWAILKSHSPLIHLKFLSVIRSNGVWFLMIFIFHTNFFCSLAYTCLESKMQMWMAVTFNLDFCSLSLICFSCSHSFCQTIEWEKSAASDVCVVYVCVSGQLPNANWLPVQFSSVKVHFFSSVQVSLPAVNLCESDCSIKDWVTAAAGNIENRLWETIRDR